MTPPQPPAAVPLRPLGVAELLDAAVRVVRDNPRASFGIALPVAVVHSGLTALFLASTVWTSNDGGIAWSELLATAALNSLFATLLAGLLAPAFTDQVVAGVRPGPGACLRRVGRSGWALAALAVVVAVALEAGLVLLVVGGVWLWGLWALAAPALVIERLGPVRALRRSQELVRSRFWRVWGLRALGWVLTTALATLITLPFTVLAGWLGDADLFDLDGSGGTIGSPRVYVTVTALGGLLASALLSPVAAAVDTMLYLDARMRGEAMDIVLGLRADDRGADIAARDAADRAAAPAAGSAAPPPDPVW